VLPQRPDGHSSPSEDGESSPDQRGTGNNLVKCSHSARFSSREGTAR
jgi:hypothetical protein